ncbi:MULTISPECIES: ChrR family anti-sigma-E factor [Nitratireductor]|uniref:ChrR family anti-sigma-E factor n=1 Tax=Nitratireductor TaxID=245876 RepID=UPI000D0D7F5E|nr:MULTISPECIES: ChrR family anti-sigma-E factor [Nitratireductor]PSM18007.1 transcriptional regulator [Nitratireductor sp. StC3]
MSAVQTADSLIASHVAGTLPLPAHVLVAAHLQLNNDNRAFAGELERLGGLGLSQARPVALSDRDRRLASVLDGPAPAAPSHPQEARDGLFPPVLRDFVGFDVADVPWRTKMPGFREHDVGEIDGCHVSLFWIRPGRAIPAHTHGGLELTLVLDGAFNDVNGRYARGDISIADETVEHRPVAEKDRPCIGLAVTDAPLRLSGPLGRRLIDIVGG